MNKNEYIRKTIKKIKCGASKKKEIKKQLETDIEIRLEQGESFGQVISEMGSPKEFAEGFNENLSSAEKRKYRWGKICKIVLPVVVIIAIIVGLLCRFIPKTVDIENSQYFEKAQVENTMKETISLLDQEDYNALKELSIGQMDAVLNEEAMAAAKGHISDNFGQQVSCGPAYIAEIVQNGSHFAVGEITVSYENVSVTYRLTYDENMELAGLYMR